MPCAKADQGFDFIRGKNRYITPAVKYLKVVIPSEAGIQKKHWMPDQVRHDGFVYLVARLICTEYVINFWMSFAFSCFRDEFIFY
jgi:hypothetical protein